jgi:hypothetical protein
MAAITFNTARQAEHIREWLKTGLTVLRQMLDAFAGYRMRRATAEAGHVRPRQRRDTSSPSIPA